jgi:5'-deoxynucleotidase YfbR-like HD superfamily hydrolase
MPQDVFGPSLQELWLEYEAQVSVESRWVKVMDRLMPFIVNLSTQGAVGESIAGASKLVSLYASMRRRSTNGWSDE